MKQHAHIQPSYVLCRLQTKAVLQQLFGIRLRTIVNHIKKPAHVHPLCHPPKTHYGLALSLKPVQNTHPHSFTNTMKVRSIQT